MKTFLLFAIGVCAVVASVPVYGQTVELHEPTLAPDMLAPSPSTKQIEEKQTHYVGLGWQRSKELVTFPVRHPVLTFNKTTFPIRHPLMAFEKFGHIVEPYQPAMNFVSAASGPATAAGVFSIGHK